MKKLAAAILALAVTYPSVAMADDNIGACESVICLTGGLFNVKGLKNCGPAVHRFASIRKYDQHHRFMPELTLLWRTAYIESCRSGDKKTVRAILLKFGDQEHVNLPI